MTGETPTSLQIAADVGGTFTDVVMIDDRGGLWIEKIPSTPPHFERAVLEGIRRILEATGANRNLLNRVAHGTTVATNAVLERRGARTALVTTRGFRDVLELRRLRAPQIYDLFFEKPKALIDRSLRLELNERLAADGKIVTPIAIEELSQICDRLRNSDVEAIAVCLLHSFAFPEHEEQVGKILRKAFPDLPVSLSCEVVRERREYERTATTAVNAYVLPAMRKYLGNLEKGLREMGVSAPLLIMQSAGGLTSATDAAERPVFILESGPAAGVLGARNSAQRIGKPSLFSLDMGGTTAKACLIENGLITYSAEYEVGGVTSAGNRLVGGGGELILAPTIDLAEVGAGGGSIAYLDSAGGFRVGPRSAGATPGPVCYGLGGTEPTVTDANVVLGYIPRGKLATGNITLDGEAASRAINERIAQPLNLGLIEAALGIHRIANAHMLRALREVSTQRGRDPREFHLIAFGGSGPIHAAGLARELDLRSLIIPPMPGLFSAVGMLISGIEHHDVRSCLLRGSALSAANLRALVGEMRALMLERFHHESCSEKDISFECRVDMRYFGQASVIGVRWHDRSAGLESIRELELAFSAEYERLYGRRNPTQPIPEAVAVRLVGRAGFTQAYRLREGGLPEARAPFRQASFGPPWGTIETPVADRRSLGQPTRGPLLIDEYDSTIVVPPDMTARLDPENNVIVEAS